MRILITGASGFLGSHLGLLLSKHSSVLGTFFRNLHTLPFPSVQLDLSDTTSIQNLLDGFQPEIVIHSAAMSAIMVCEEYPSEAEKVNVLSTYCISQWCTRQRAKLIFISSDQVFSGKKGNYIEADLPDPINQYGRTKWEAEQITLSAAERNLVIRSNSLVGTSLGWGESFSERVFQRTKSGQQLYLFNDQFRSPIHIRTMVAILEQVCKEKYVGVLNIGGPERMSRYEIGQSALVAAGLSLDFITSSSYKTHSQSSLLTPDCSYDISEMRARFPEIPIQTIAEDLTRERVSNRHT